jgi:hypothetical protein
MTFPETVFYPVSHKFSRIVMYLNANL